MIDLHLHTTASDGALAPAELVARAKAVGLTTISVTDHDTMGAAAEVEGLARDAGLDFVPGIELTTVWRGSDVHLLGYFLDWQSPRIQAFLSSRSEARRERAHRIGERLQALGMPLDIDALIAAADIQSVGRPLIARALVDAGLVASIDEAFDRFLGEGAPACVQHLAETPRAMIEFVEAEGGLVSFAHPGVTNQDDLLAELSGQGLHGVEAYHPEHSKEETARYLAFARERGLLVTGGSDYHGDNGSRRSAFGSVVLPRDEFDRLLARRKPPA
jgi:predicted metal-dependent phosphoesterase TrpH